MNALHGETERVRESTGGDTAQPSLGTREGGSRPRAATCLLGLLLMCGAFACQAPVMIWTFRHGIPYGYDSGKATLHIFWTIVMLMIDSATLTAWLCIRPARGAWAVVPPIILLVSMILAIPLASLCFMLVQIFIL